MTVNVDGEFDDSTDVTEGGVTVEKSLVTDDFPVPVVEFRIRSEADDPVEVRLVDEVPESFPMDGVGFHPDYDGEAWTAYGDHRVEYECTVAPDEAVRTVYGIRIDDATDVAEFLAAPTLDVRGTGEASTDAGDAEDVLGRDTTRAVRDALAGEGELDAPSDGDVAAALGTSDATNEAAGSAADGEDEPPADESTSAETDDSGAVELSQPADIDTGGSDAGSEEPVGEDGPDDPFSGTDSGDLTESSDGDTGIELTDPTADEGTMDVPDPAPPENPSASAGGNDDAVGSDAADPDPSASESVAATLAAEIRSGDVADDDLEVLREELDLGTDEDVPASVDVRIRRLQTRTEDLAAYTDAMAEFLDEEGTGQELIEGFRDDVAALRENLDAVEDELESAREARASLAESTDELTGRQASLSTETYGLAAGQASLVESTDELADRTASLETEAAELSDATETVEDRLDETVVDLDVTTDRVEMVDDEVGQVRSDVSSLRESVEGVRADVESLESVEDDLSDLRESVEDLRTDLEAVESLEGDVADLRGTVEGVEDDIETLMQFRDRLNQAFGPGE